MQTDSIRLAVRERIASCEAQALPSPVGCFSGKRRLSPIVGHTKLVGSRDLPALDDVERSEVCSYRIR